MRTSGRSPGDDRGRLLRQLREMREVTRQDLADRLGVSLPTAAARARWLIRNGYAVEAGYADSSGGRKPLLLRFDPGSRRSIGVEVEPGTIRFILTDLDAAGHARRERSIDERIDAGALLDVIADGVEALIGEAGIDRSRLLGVGISLPGTVETQRPVLRYAPNMHLRDVDFRLLRRRLNLPVISENEANAAALSERVPGGTASDANLIFLSIKSGLGAGIVLGGRLYRGVHGTAGEFGHMMVEPSGRDCACGRSGCWERYCSETALLSDWRFRGGSGGNGGSLEAFSAALSADETAAQNAWESFLGFFARGLLNVIACFDPAVVVIGLRDRELGRDLAAQLSERLRSEGSIAPSSRVRIASSELGPDASLNGAALLPLIRHGWYR